MKTPSQSKKIDDFGSKEGRIKRAENSSNRVRKKCLIMSYTPILGSKRVYTISNMWGPKLSNNSGLKMSVDQFCEIGHISQEIHRVEMKFYREILDIWKYIYVNF